MPRPALFIIVALLAPGPAFATVTSSFAAGVLTVASDASDSITVSCTGVGGNVTINDANPGTGPVACAAVTQLVVNGGPGANTIDIQGASSVTYTALTNRTIDCGAGGDVVQGSNLIDVMIGGSGADTFNGNQGNDLALMGEDGDTFAWDPGDGNDTVEGQSGVDVLQFNGSAANENINLAPNGQRVLFLRDIANIIMDLDDVEQLEFNAVGGADNIVVNSLAGTDMTQVSLRLASVVGGATGDTVVDHVTVNGSAGADSITADAMAGAVTVANGATSITITTLEPAMDNLTLNGGDGSDTLTIGVGLAGQVATLTADGGIGTDTVTARGTSGTDTIAVGALAPILSAGGTALVDVLSSENVRLDGLDGADALSASGDVAPLFDLIYDGGAGADILSGGNGDDVMIAGNDVDFLDGNLGADVMLAGAGDDIFQWNPGDGSDVLEGQDGADTLRFNGSAANENINASANGSRLLFTRDIATVTMDANDVEQVDYNALGGADNVVVNNLTGTDVTLVRVLLAGTVGGSAGDLQPDNVTVNAGAAAEVMALTDVGGVVTLTRGGFVASVHTAEPASDRLTVNALAGDDTFSLTSAVATLIGITLDGGSGSGMPGDIVSLSGEVGAENYQIAPNITRVSLSRSAPSGFVVDLNAFEWLQLDLDAGADTLNTQALTTTSQLLNGGAPSVAPADTLNVAGFTGDVLASPIALAGRAPIVHSNFEQTATPLLIESFLTGAQETPPNPSPGRGFGTVTLNGARDAIIVFLQYSGLLGNNTLAHIHGPAPRRVAAAPIIDLPASGSTSGMFTVGPFAVTPTQVTDLKSGRWYFNVHSTAPGSSGGEIRGQIDNSMFRDSFE